MFSGGFSNPFKSVHRRLSQGFQRAGEILAIVGPSPVKSLRNALIAGDEAKAIELYTSTNKDGHSLEEDLHPSMPFSLKRYGDNTPLHIASQMALGKLVELFIEHGGCPTTLNSRQESCLHCICSRDDRPEVRKEIMKHIMDWRGEVDSEGSITPLQVSVNRVDIDGNAAIHYAARNGLDLCVQILLEAGAIISLVNKAQRTCCEMADENAHKDLALMLELALVFQPEDINMADFDRTHRFSHQDHAPVLALDSASFKMSQLDTFILNTIHDLCVFFSNGTDAVIGMSHVEALLNAFTWDVERLKKEWSINPEATFSYAHLVIPSRNAKEALISSPQSTEALAVVLGPPSSNISLSSYTKPQVLDLPVVDECALSTHFHQTINEHSMPLAHQAEESKGLVKDGECRRDSEDSEVGVSVRVIPRSRGATSSPLKRDSSAEGSMNTFHVDNFQPQSNTGSFMELSSSSYCPVETPMTSFPPTPPNFTPAKMPPYVSTMPLPAPAPARLPPLPPPPPSPLPLDVISTPPLILASVPPSSSCPICCECLLQPVSVAETKNAPICELGRRAILCSSGHAFCYNCWSTYLSFQVNDNGAHSLQCPAFKCGEVLDGEWAEVLFDKKLASRYRKQRKRHVVDCCPNLRWCPVDECGLIVYVSSSAKDDPDAPRVVGNYNSNLGHDVRRIGGDYSQTVVCGNGHSFCLSCASEAHAPCNCNDWQRWQAKVREECSGVGAKSGDEIANALWVAANTKRCPRCTTPIEKDEGCNHMNCCKCRHEFCWICMQDWSLHSNSTGGFFQCNRFIVSDDIDEMAFGRGFSEEHGSARAESVRMKGKGQRMARFIHHFTRFQAHGDSASMEARMQGECVARIQDGLRASYDGSIKWFQVCVPNPFSQVSRTSKHSLSRDLDRGILSSICSDDDNADKGGDGFVHPDMNFSSLSIVGGSPSSAPPCFKVFRGGAEIENNSNPLQFLFEGFDELLKSRQILRGSFVYAFYAFGDEDNASGGSRTPRKRQSRSRIDNRRQSFEQQQAEMEMLTEMLSDVVARRRLRASRNQIIQATTAARSKRVEMEELVLSFLMADRISESDEQISSHTRGAPFFLPTTSTNIKRRSRGNGSNIRLGNSLSHAFGREDVNNIDIAAFLSEIEFSRPENHGPSERTPTELTAHTRAIMRALDMHVNSSSVSPRESINRHRQNRGNDEETSVLSRAVESSDSSHSFPPEDVASRADDDDDDDGGDWASVQAALCARAVEEEAYQRAILMSLQDPPRARASYSHVLHQGNDHDVGLESENTGRTIGSGMLSAPERRISSISTSTDRISDTPFPVASPPPDDAIERLVMMGFSRDDVVSALIETNNDVEAAANRLF